MFYQKLLVLVRVGLGALFLPLVWEKGYIIASAAPHILGT